MTIYIRNFLLGCLIPVMLAMLMFGVPTAFAGETNNTQASLYDRLGGYNAIAAVVNDLFPRLAGDKKLGRFWRHRGSDGIAREKQLLIDFFAAKSGGQMYYRGRTMKLLHTDMKIDEKDWRILITAVNQTLDKFQVPARERKDLLDFIESTKKDIVEQS